MKKNKFSIINAYTILTVVIILSFQIYWLYNTFCVEKKQMENELANQLKSFVLALDTQEMIHTDEKGIALSIPKNMIVEKQQNLPIESLDLNIKLKQLDSAMQLHPELTKKLFDAILEQAKEANKKELQDKLITDINKNYPQLVLSLSKTSNSPVKLNKGKDFVITQVSTLKPDELYVLSVKHINLAVLNGISFQLGISVIYLLVCFLAVILLTRAIRKNRLLSHAKDVFAQNMTHELKTPIATLSATAEALHNFNFIEDTTKARDYIKLMIQDIRSLDDMTTTILTNVRLNQNSLVMDLEPLDIKLLINEAVHHHDPRINLSGAKIVVEIQGNSIVMGDRVHLRNVINNLLDNALKYTTVIPEILIKAERIVNSKILITISDNGIGIPSAYKEEIFKPYFRINKSNIHTVKGFGIGLSYSREVVIRHNGSIVLASSEEGKGSSFEIILPIKSDE